MSRKMLMTVIAPLLLAAAPVSAQPDQPMSDDTFNAVDNELSEQAAAQAAQINPPPPVPMAGPAPAAPDTTSPPIPPYVEGAPVAAPTGGYCYGGPHPVDTRYAPGPTWDPTSGPHTHPYAPIDLRLYAFKDGCYYFVGDPHDFGYSGQTYPYYGAHPVLDVYGGGWCFMIGPHSHFWRPWSPHFTIVGSWYYWEGPYDPFFWSYWPYYSHYYRDYYPHYYRGGYFYRPGGFRAAPPITRVPSPSGWHGRPGPTGNWGANNYHSAPAPSGPAAGWRGNPAPATNGGWHGNPAPATPAPSTGGGWHGNPAPATPAPSTGGSWRGTPSASPAPSHWGGSSAPSHAPSPVRSGGGGGWHRR